MPRFIRLLALVSVVLGAWTVWGWWNARTLEEPAYTVLERRDGYEVRQYPAYLVAQVSIPGAWADAFSDGFRAISDYTSGDNTTQASIGMHAPVDIQLEPESETISSSAPVIAEVKKGQWLISFILPAKYSLGNIPRPNNPQIRLVEIPAQKIAVRTFSGRVRQERSQAQQVLLSDLLKRDKVTILSSFRLAQYNAPWTPPFLRRNEIIVTIR